MTKNYKRDEESLVFDVFTEIKLVISAIVVTLTDGVLMQPQMLEFCVTSTLAD